MTSTLLGVNPSTSSINRTFDGLRCLVLGGGGFLGINLCNALAMRGAEVQSFGRSVGTDGGLDGRVIHTTGVFGDAEALAKAVAGQDIVYHLISGSVPESSNREPAADLTANVLTTIHLLEICRAERIKKIIFTSSGGTIYGIPKTVPIPESAPTDPISSYGISKLVIEKYLALYHRLYDIDFQVLRIANPYGPFQSGYKKQGVVAALIHRALRGDPLEIWGDGDVVRDFIHVDDVVSALLEGFHYTGPHRVMNVGSGVGLSIGQVVADIEAVLGKGPLPKIHRAGRSADVPVNVLDISTIVRETGWRPKVRWSDGLRGTVEWIERTRKSV